MDTLKDLDVSVFTLQSIKSRIETYNPNMFHFSSSWFLLYSPLNQGLKLSTSEDNLYNLPVFTLQSIKSRIETILLPEEQSIFHQVFTLQSIKSRIETGEPLSNCINCHSVFTLQSIKSRIETASRRSETGNRSRFLLYSPLNQGLKH